MKFRHLAVGIGMAASTLVVAMQAPANAFNFKTNYSTDFSGNDRWVNNIWLDSVEFNDEVTGEFKSISDFTLVNYVDNVTNDLWTGGNSGAASVDLGDKATLDMGNGTILTRGVEAPDSAQLSAVLSNNNLNNIIDTEDSGNFAMDLYFDQAVDNLFVWERGMNSKMDLQAIDNAGNAVGSLFALSSSSSWDYAGFNLNTQEIGGTQKVSSLGVSMADLGVEAPIAGVRVFSRGRAYRGPDWKILGSVAENQPNPESVPEPSAMLGLLAVGAIAAKRLKQA
ncbi:exosortase-dependent surface protein XDP2 [Leptothoe kymatousa]|uniref:PEP-CTERM sorting domain-containing protein n=1 Tax=Leptothoe kymatousa TAU-MAC 1615 TaxID=2364775 RepID=A0ABS5Y7I5_9CYAN|nr:exosortase-dependent surface protein XDP2 [Leptothoe kymatousa]MBT9313731.1 PEP-CTERM sorting domain-containing protein [Leptothoe kymatousa TAU-MAC 1615]